MVTTHPFSSPEITYRRVLIPFTSTCALQRSIEPAVHLLHDPLAELILLHVSANPAHECTESVYRELRGVQAQWQSSAIVMHLDSVVGPTASAIVAYAGDHAVDLIVMTQEDEATQREVASEVVLQAHCHTLFVN